jgi:hypothetical protein
MFILAQVKMQQYFQIPSQVKNIAFKATWKSRATGYITSVLYEQDRNEGSDYSEIPLKSKRKESYPVRLF